MAEKVTRNYKIAAQGVLTVDNNRIFIDVEDRGEFELSKLLQDFDGKSVKFTCTYDEDYTESEDPGLDLEIDEDTGEVL